MKLSTAANDVLPMISIILGSRSFKNEPWLLKKRQIAKSERNGKGCERKRRLR
jgi:hypothetical protein